MKNIFSNAFLVLSLLLFLNSCQLKDTSAPTEETSTVTLAGQVVDASTGNGLIDATVRITDGSIVKGTTTDSQGKFSTTFTLASDVDLQLIAFKDGYVSDTTTVFATANSTIAVPLFQLSVAPGGSGIGTGGASGVAASIILYDLSQESIGVKESGSIESAEIIFEVRDSSGTVIDQTNAVSVSFRFGSAPGGGEYLYPASVITNALGRASVNLNTGRVAGVIQVIAESTIGNITIRSKPVLVAIHGGLPVSNLFDVASPKLNYPAFGILGFQIPFSAYLGDKYSNPVRPGTAVYFSTNSGIIEGSALTSNLGVGTVTLLTQGNPNDPVYGPGFFTVTAKTADEDYNTISTETVRLLSGAPIISVNPVVVDINNGGSQTFTYTVADVNGNPMSSGQSISVSVKNGDIELAGATSVLIPDTQSRGWTSFSFVALDAKPDTVDVKSATIEISTSGANGNVKTSISGITR